MVKNRMQYYAELSVVTPIIRRIVYVGLEPRVMRICYALQLLLLALSHEISVAYSLFFPCALVFA